MPSTTPAAIRGRSVVLAAALAALSGACALGDVAPRFETAAMQGDGDVADGVCLWVHPTDHHPNEVGHRIAAEEIYRFLKQEGLLDLLDAECHRTTGPDRPAVRPEGRPPASGSCSSNAATGS